MDADVEAGRAMQEPNHYTRVGLEHGKLLHQSEKKFMGVTQCIWLKSRALLRVGRAIVYETWPVEFRKPNASS